MNLAFRKCAWGLAPVGNQSMEFIKNLETGKTFVAKLIEDERSLSQNRLYWRWVSEIGNAQGYGKDELHERFKKHYALPILVRDDEDMAPFLERVQGLGTDAYDEFVRRYISTTDLSVKQFSEMLDEISRDAVQRGIRLTDPEELKWVA